MQCSKARLFNQVIIGKGGTFNAALDEKIWACSFGEKFETWDEQKRKNNKLEGLDQQISESKIKKMVLTRMLLYKFRVFIETLRDQTKSLSLRKRGDWKSS